MMGNNQPLLILGSLQAVATRVAAFVSGVGCGEGVSAKNPQKGQKGGIEVAKTAGFDYMY
jgi:hypothetical protein